MQPVRIPQSLRWGASALFVLGSYLLVALYSLTLPAIYLDEINPDYLAVRMLTPNSHTDAWIPPAKYFADRFLLLTNPYSGALHGYLQAPFFYFLGGSIESFRISHVFLGILVLAAFYASVARLTRSLLLATVSALVLAVDPAFVFAFRTQGFQQLFPTFFTLLGILLCCKGEARPRRLIAAGIFFGFSVWGYFIFGFFIPGLLLAVFLQDRLRRWQRAFALTAGIILGYLPTVFGYIDAFLAFGSWPPMLGWMRGTVSGMQRAYHPPGVTGLMGILASNVAGVAQHLWILLTSEWIWQVMFGLLHKDPGQYLKAAVLMLLPVSAFLYQKLNRPADRAVHNALLMSLLAIWSYLLICVMFGGLL